MDASYLLCPHLTKAASVINRRAPRLRSLLAASLVAPMLASMQAAPAAAVDGLEGSVGGIVQYPDPITGELKPVGAICVDVFDSQERWQGGATTGATGPNRGTFLINGLPADTYRTRFRDCGTNFPENGFGALANPTIATEWAGNRLTFAASTTFVIDGDEAADGGEDCLDCTFLDADEAVDVDLQFGGGSVSGLVRDQDTNAAIGGICVLMYDGTGNLIAETATRTGQNNVGTWTGNSQLPPAEYRFEFRDDVQNCGSVLRPGGIGGGAADQTKANPSTGSVAVATFDPVTSPQRYTSEFFINKATLATADRRELFEGGTIIGTPTNAGVDADLAPVVTDAAIAGTVTVAGGGVATDVCVSLYTGSGSPSLVVKDGLVNPDITDGSGRFSFTNLVAGQQYLVEVHERCVGQPGSEDDLYVAEVHPDLFYPDQDNGAEPLTVLRTAPSTAKVTTSPGVTTTVNPSIGRRGTISGTVTNTPASGEAEKAIGNVCVTAEGDEFAVPAPTALTSVSGGTYTLVGVRPGQYVVEFSTDPNDCSGLTRAPLGSDDEDPADYRTEFYNGRNSRATADAVAVASGGTRSAIDADLLLNTATSSVIGTVKVGGVATQGVCVSIFDPAVVNPGTDGVVDSVLTGADGSYTLADVPVGSWVVRFARPSVCGLVGPAADANPGDPLYVATEFHDNQRRAASAKLVSVSQSAPSTVDADLAAGARLSGTVTFDGTADDVCVELLSTSGTLHYAQEHVAAPTIPFTFDALVPDSYVVRYDDRGPGITCGGVAFTGGTDQYLTEFYANARSLSAATPRTLVAGGTRTATDAQLDSLPTATERAPGFFGYVVEPDTDGSDPDVEELLNGIVVDVFRIDQDPAVDEPMYTTTTRTHTIRRERLICPDGSQYFPNAAQGVPTEGCYDASGPGPTEVDPEVVTDDELPVAGWWIIHDANQQNPVEPGFYKIRFRDPRGIYATEWHQRRNSFENATSEELKVTDQFPKEIGEKGVDLDDYCYDQRDPEEFFTCSERDSIVDGDEGNPDNPYAAFRGNGNEQRTVLGLAGSVSGQVTREDTDVPAGNVRVDLLDDETGVVITTAFTGTDGRYLMPGLAPGLYKVLFTPADAQLSTEYFSDRSNFGEADLISVSQLSETSNVDASLEVNNPPVAGDDRVTAEVNTTTNIATLLGNDVDPDGDVVTIVSVTQGEPHGTVTLLENGTVDFTPQTDNQGDTSFTYTIEDESGLTSTATVTVNIVGQIIGDPPIARDDEATTGVGQAVTINVVANDDDPDGDDSLLVIDSVGNPFHGTAVINGQSLRYTPEAGFTGLDQFAYSITDAQGFTASARVTVAVGAANETGASKSVEAGGRAATEGTAATPENTIITTVQSPNAGQVTIRETDGQRTTSNGVTTIEPRVDITAPNASASNPLTITFRIDGSVLQGLQPQRAIRVLRNGTALADCLGSSAASPDPCLSGHRMIGDDVLLTVKTSRASTWTFAFLDQAVVDRAAVQGAGREDTAVRVARQAFSPAEVDTVLIARSDTYPDALAGAPLAHQLGAPLLLTRSDALNAVTRDEILRLGASRVIILGGPNAVSTGVENTIRNLNGVQSVERIAGPNRFATAKLIADQLDPYTSAYVVEGANANPSRGWPDAVSVAGLAAFQGRPIFLVTKDELPADTRNALQGLSNATVIGGPGAVSTAVLEQIRSITGSANRIAGNSRFETNYQVALAARDAGMSPSSTWIATGLNFPDALAAGAAVAKEGGILLLVHGTDYSGSPRVKEWLSVFKSQIESVTITGGTGAVSASVETQIRQDVAR